MTQEEIQTIIASSRSERLSDAAKRPIPEDHVTHIVQLTGWGHSALAADHLLFPEITGVLPAVVGGVIRALSIQVAATRLHADDDGKAIERSVRTRQFAYETLLEMAINFSGMESRWLDAEEKRTAIQRIRHALAEWEAGEPVEGEISVAAAVVGHFLTRMKLVQKGASMVAGCAGRIEHALDFGKPVLLAFLDKARDEIEGSIYTRMVHERCCRFGNDYALGLRWLRHLGFEQVSTNPVLAALAYQDDPTLRQGFEVGVRTHRKFAEWAVAPEKSGDEVALYATLLALWDNLHVYRPIFFNLAGESGGGVVSFQLNPNVAHLVQESVRDAFTAFAEATEDLRVYDDYLLAGYSTTRERARPNMVIKVAASSPAAREIARTLNGFGIGSNITVVFTSGQQVAMILEELAGMADALKKGIIPTQLYMTNMGGRFESHLREVKLEELFGRLKAKVGEARALGRVNQLAAANGTKTKVDQADGFETKVVAATRYASQRTIDANMIAALGEVVSGDELKTWEDVIGKSGTLVARRVWRIFFSPENRERWMDYLCRTHDVTREQATLIFNRIYYLPASKRKPQDTYWALSGANMVHTEFPNHQESVRRTAEAEGFRLMDYAESITGEFPPQVLEWLNRISDFRAGYELTPELNKILRDVGISGDFGAAGPRPDQWPEFGSVKKTLTEFKGAYDAFRRDMLKLFADVARAAPPENTGQRAKRSRSRR